MALAASDLVALAASGDHSAVEEVRSILAEPGFPPRPFAGPANSKPDGRRRKYPSGEEATGKSADDLTIKLIANWLRIHGSRGGGSPPPDGGPSLDVFAYSPAESVGPADGVEKSSRLRLPWRHRGRVHGALRG